MTTPTAKTNTSTTHRPRSTWRFKIGLGIAILLVMTAASTLLPAVKVVSCTQHAIMGNDVRQFVISVLALANENERWPTSLEDYRQQCQKAKIDDQLARIDRRIFVAWDQFARAEKEKRVLPVCVMFDGKRAAVGFSDGHYEYPSTARIEKIIQAGLSSLSP